MQAKPTCYFGEPDQLTYRLDIKVNHRQSCCALFFLIGSF